MLSKINRAAFLLKPHTQLRFFGAAAVPEPLSISTLHKMGQDNLALTKMINYENYVKDGVHAQSHESDTYVNFADMINKDNFGDLVKTEPVDRLSKRVGLMGYKMGQTFFWDRWGTQQGCTVISIDRCQVIQVKQKE